MTTGNRQPPLGNRKKLKLGSLGLCATLFALSIPAGAQQPKKIHLIGILRNDTPALFASRNQALLQGLHELGYVDGENIRFEYRYAERNLNRLPELAAELVGLKVDVIVVGGGTTSVARKATTTIPIVVGSAGDLVGGGHVASLGAGPAEMSRDQPIFPQTSAGKDSRY